MTSQSHNVVAGGYSSAKHCDHRKNREQVTVQFPTCVINCRPHSDQYLNVGGYLLKYTSPTYCILLALAQGGKFSLCLPTQSSTGYGCVSVTIFHCSLFSRAQLFGARGPLFSLVLPYSMEGKPE